MTHANVERKKKKSKKDQKTNHTLRLAITKKMKYTSGNKRVLQKLQGPTDIWERRNHIL